MKTLALIAVAGAAPVGAVVGAMLKLDAKEKGWSHRPWPAFILAGTVICLVGALLLVGWLGGFTRSD